jgi:hypothetical protein
MQTIQTEQRMGVQRLLSRHQSRLITSKGLALYKVIQENNLNILSTGETTYWPTDSNKIPDLLDFAVIKGISDVYSTI